jgi:hypothetical protein
VSQRFSLTKHCHHFLSSRSYPDGVFVDMTVGKGKDLSFLVDLAAHRLDHLMAIDIQDSALVQSAEFIKERGFDSGVESIQWRQGSHEYIHEWLLDWPMAQKGVSLALYNLGYLPGSDKSITTQSASTLKSLEGLMPWICPGGGISLMVYPGHETGRLESLEIDRFLEKNIDTQIWHLWQMRRLGSWHAPYWIWMQKLA